MEKKNISIAEAESLISGAMTANGVPDAVAKSVATALVAAEAEGQIGHGFSRLADYVAQFRSGKVNQSAEPQCKVTGDTAFLIDAQNGFAFPALDMAIERGTEAALKHGSATMSVTRSHHCGALSVQVEKIANAGLVGMMVANTPSAIAPWGSKTPLFGTNPIAFAAPRRDGPPLVIDLSLSRVARGKVMNAKKTGQAIPLGWALDSDGRPTTDPDAALAGSMVPIGEAKGTALALIVEVLAAVMTGANTSSEMSSFFASDGPPPGGGQFLMAMKPHDLAGFTARMEVLAELISNMDGARLPGKRRAEAIARSRSEGLNVPSHYLEAARAMANGSAQD